jgi:syntaxin 16
VRSLCGRARGWGLQRRRAPGRGLNQCGRAFAQTRTSATLAGAHLRPCVSLPWLTTPWLCVRSDDKAKNADSSRLLATALGGAAGGDAPGGSVTLNMPPQWVQVSDDVTASMGRIKDRLNQLAALHARALLPNFDEFSGEDAKVEVLTQEITRLFKRCEKSLQALSASQAADPGDGKVRQNVVRSMAADLQKLSMDFRRKQKDYLTKLKQLQDRGPGGDVFGDLTGGGGGEGEGGGSSYDVGFTDMQIQRTNTMIDEAIARDQEVVKIIESVNELAAIMKDLSVLVIDQGTVLDRIDYNVEQVSTHVEEAVKQLTKAEETQKKSWMLIIMTILCGLILLMISILVLKTMIKAG